MRNAAPASMQSLCGRDTDLSSPGHRYAPQKHAVFDLLLHLPAVLPLTQADFQRKAMHKKTGACFVLSGATWRFNMKRKSTAFTVVMLVGALLLPTVAWSQYPKSCSDGYSYIWMLKNMSVPFAPSHNV